MSIISEQKKKINKFTNYKTHSLFLHQSSIKMPKNNFNYFLFLFMLSATTHSTLFNLFEWIWNEFFLNLCTLVNWIFTYAHIWFSHINTHTHASIHFNRLFLEFLKQIKRKSHLLLVFCFSWRTFPITGEKKILRHFLSKYIYFIKIWFCYNLLNVFYEYSISI